MDKVVCTFSYGLCVISVDKIKVFLKEEKVRAKNHEFGSGRGYGLYQCHFRRFF